MSTLYLFSLQPNTPGVSIIINNLSIALKKQKIDSTIIQSLECVDFSNDLVIPFGIKESYILKQKTKNLHLSMLIDAYTLGCWNKVLFYMRKRKFWYFDLYYSFLSFIRYAYKEYAVANSYKKIMLVSSSDVSYLKVFNKNVDIICVPNGVDIPKSYTNKTPNQKICLGVISHWTKVSFDELNWFLEDYYEKLKTEFPNLEMKIAGKGCSESMASYFDSIDGVNFIGEISELSDFFDQIDIFVATIPKGCGILNKILDAFSYKKIVIGLECCFKSFPMLKNGYISCNKYQDFSDAIRLFIENPDKISQLSNNSYLYVKRHHDWTINYYFLAKEISKIVIK